MWDKADVFLLESDIYKHLKFSQRLKMWYYETRTRGPVIVRTSNKLWHLKPGINSLKNTT